MTKTLTTTCIRFFLKVGAGFLGISILSVLLFRVVPVYVTPLMLLRCAEQLLEGRKPQLRHQWVELKEISKNLHLAVVCSEDQRFTSHFGFDFQAIERSLAGPPQHSGRLRGASTISQQTAKNVFLLPYRSWIRKGLEVYFTVLIEFFWPKERILEVYLNSIEMGDGIYGAEAAARRYYHIGAGQLSVHQAAAIAAILPSPRKYRANPPSPYIRKRISWITGQMRKMETVKFR